MQVCRSIAEAQSALAEHSRPRALVPTMGALHAGHAALIERARAAAGRDGSVIVSIFVNPMQFGPDEDLNRYPRDLDADLDVCAAHGADIVFAPPEGEVYASDASTEVRETRLSVGMCGGSRPGHFAGVCTVVLKLFNMLSPDRAVFGRKDFQQLAVIRRMVRDLNVPVEIIAADTVREADGLALSSRNRFLNAAERDQAAAIFRCLRRCRDQFRAGESNPERLRDSFIADFQDEAPLATLDYIELVDGESLAPSESASEAAVLAVGAFFGKTRLIDSISLA